MNKQTVIELIVIIILVICLTIMVVMTKNVIDSKYSTSNNMQNGSSMDMPGGNMQSNSNIEYSASNEITEESSVDGNEYTSENSDENALSISGDINVSLNDVTVTKTGDTSASENSSFYGTNSGIIAKDGANVTITNSNITTDAQGANGVFSFGGSATTNNSLSDGTQISISDSTITTKQDNSGGIMTTGGGTTIANNLTVTTEGTSSAAIRSDRGGGNVEVTEGTYTTNGIGSPAIYSTAIITVKDAKLVSNASEGIVIEGANSVDIENCSLVDSNTKLNGQSTTYKNIFLYQSVSGDASEGTASFTAKNSNITTNNGDTFYVTNSEATINVENTSLVNNDKDGYLLRIQKDSWGNEGSNGGTVTFNSKNQNLDGEIYVDEISTLSMNLSDNSTFNGSINKDNLSQNVTLTLDNTSKITLTGDTYVSSLDDADLSYSNIDLNGYTLYVNGVALEK